MKKIITHKGFSLLETLISIVLASVMLIMILTLLNTYDQVKSKKAKIGFIVETLAFINERHLGDWEYFSKLANVQADLHPYPIYRESGAIKTYYLYYDEHLRPLDSPTGANFYLSISYYPQKVAHQEIVLLATQALSTTYGQYPYVGTYEIYPAVAIKKEG